MGGGWRVDGGGQRARSFFLTAAVGHQSCNAVKHTHTHTHRDVPEAVLDCTQGNPCRITAEKHHTQTGEGGEKVQGRTEKERG